jgi:tRNA threonylcarbamoyladenosine biosynthesis protein TsaE
MDRRPEQPLSNSPLTGLRDWVGHARRGTSTLVTHESRSVSETESIAADLARTLAPCSAIALHGNLGAGKTQFVRGLLIGLGGNPRAVSSPTYVLLNIYDSGRMPLFHLDAYRVSGPEDFEAIGFGELFEQGGVVVVEWAARVAALMPPDTIQVHLTPVGETLREIRIE